MEQKTEEKKHLSTQEMMMGGPIRYHDREAASTYKKEPTSSSGIATQVAVYTASIGAGFLSMWGAIRENFYSGLKNASWIKKIRDKRAEDYEKIANLCGAEYSKAHMKIHIDYTEAVGKALEEKGFTNSWKKFKHLTKNQKVKVVGIAVTVAATAVGAITMIRQNREISRQLEEMKHRDDNVGSDFRSREDERQQQSEQVQRA